MTNNGTPEVKAQVVVSLLTNGWSEDTYVAVTYTSEAPLALDMLRKGLAALEAQFHETVAPRIVSPNSAGIRRLG